MFLGKMSRSGLLIAALAIAVIATPASATVLVEDFNSFSLGGPYGVWAEATSVLTSGADSFRVQTISGWGGGWCVLDSVVDASGEDNFELDITFGAANQTPVIVLGLEDGDGTFFNYAWYGLPTSGSQTLESATASNFWESAAGSVAGFDMSTVTAFHIQADGNPDLMTDVYFENLNATPEPATLALLAIGGLAILRRR